MNLQPNPRSSNLCTDFIDHMMRVFPSKNMLAIKRSFFDSGMAGERWLQQGVMAVKGIYQSLRIAQVLSEELSFG